VSDVAGSDHQDPLRAHPVILPESTAALFELLVAIMLVVLGVRSLVRAWRVDGPVHGHHHGDTSHTHAGPDPHVHVGRRMLALRPLVVGLVHGLAGSGAMTALVFAELPTSSARITYIALFGLGSVAGMAIASGLAGMSLHAVARTPTRRRAFGVATGALSITVGVIWAIPQLALL